ncbi:hypothetical protein C0Q70_02558 [Pomacea canaliculata]|uniref:Uncharacterized protein n=1 Tax=Pomacea canaliculata TaxID=400727 RepID=A0A2T7PQA7_POMCA|nr:hypothetical protein C0Q70_02558 [Pomacea canaliculata]
MPKKKIDEKMTGVSEGGRTREDTEQQREEGGERKRDRQRCQSSLLQNASTAGERQDQISDNKIRTRHLSKLPVKASTLAEDVSQSDSKELPRESWNHRLPCLLVSLVDTLHVAVERFFTPFATFPAPAFVEMIY